MCRRSLLLLPLLLAGCDSGVGLVVQLRTDLAASQDFTRVVTYVDGEQVDVLDPASGDFIEPRQVAEVDGLSPTASRDVRVVLEGGPQTAERRLLVAHEGDLVVTAVIGSDCLGVSCPDAQSCVGGTCAGVGCVSGSEPECPTPDCVDDVDDPGCPVRGACAVPTCVDGLCLYGRGPCPAGQSCDLDRGCVADVSPDAGPAFDGGPPDSGSPATDAGPGLDSGTCGLCTDVCDRCTGGSDCCQVCQRGSNCQLACDGASNCALAVTASAEGQLACTESATCSATFDMIGDVSVDCTANAACDVTCDSVSVCEVRCQTGATCSLRCTASPTCLFDICEGGEATCPDGLLVCNRPCP